MSVCFVLLSSLVLVVIWGITMMHVASEKKLAMESAAGESKNMAAIMATNLNDRMDRAILYGTIANKVLDGDPAAAEYLNLLFNGDTAYVRAAVFDGDMRLRYSSSGLPTESGFAELVRQTYPAASAAAAPPQVGSVMLGKPEGYAWRIPLLVSLNSPKNNVHGFFVAVLDIGRFLSDYKQIGDGYRVSVDGATGLPLVTLIDGKLLVGGNEGIVNKFSSNDSARSEPGVSNHRKLTAYPLAVTVSLNPDFIVADLTQSHYEYVRYAIVISIAVVSLTLILIGISYHRKKLYQRLEHSEREKICLIEQLEKEKTRAYQLASHDYLTGIPNRMLFNELAAAELSRAKRSPNLYALFFIDLDGFKPINDTLGHAVGDLLLQSVAQRLCASLREYDLVARLGGDEFVVLLSDIRYQSQIADIADKLVKTVGAPYLNLAGHEVHTSLSIGIALFPDDGHTVDELLSKADTAMYVAKKAGKGAYRFHDPGMRGGQVSRLPTDTRYLSA
ncbi:diguanylate cyclase (GGDEF) domain-containing protein [Herbaspirillum sp. CF444]|uniref:GGDEF domain-containing protein n=1 Tax=Herbaspirillum sp. CF444 TaxID=1144319 RepID=UPI0002725E06|nr:GGDEF domain-containing protein [Herbaspirillum sp. CF444]EJL82873.1 diguanylate cyclase (GGDEF) domain-containing protein [Herbaspirillum sp. CF444]